MTNIRKLQHFVRFMLIESIALPAQKGSNCVLLIFKLRASKPPDLAGDLPIFLRNNKNLPTSRFGMKISRFISRLNIDSMLAM